MIADVDVGDLKAAVAGEHDFTGPRYIAKAAILIRYTHLFWIDFLRKNLRPFLFISCFFSLFCGTFFVDEDPFSHYLGWPSA